MGQKQRSGQAPISFRIVTDSRHRVGRRALFGRWNGGLTPHTPQWFSGTWLTAILCTLMTVSGNNDRALNRARRDA
jgi:hypothetical protein